MDVIMARPFGAQQVGKGPGGQCLPDPCHEV
jgi:hypothetical protein